MKRQNLASEFWDYVKQYRGRINEVRFTYHYPNLGRASEKMKELLGDTSKVVNSTESEIVFKGKSLELDEKMKTFKIIRMIQKTLVYLFL